MRLAGKTALVTGAGGGLGRVIASSMARDGASLSLVDIDEEELAATSPTIPVDTGQTVLLLPTDLADDAAIHRAVARTHEAFGRIDILVNNAAVARPAPLDLLTARDWDAVMAVNLRAAFLLSQAVGRLMIRQGGGAIINVGSVVGVTPLPGSAAYAVSKAALASLTRQIAVEWGPHNIRCNLVAPGLTTWFMKGLAADSAIKHQQAEAVPLRRLASPTDVAEAIVYLATDAAAYVSGATLSIDGAYVWSLLAGIPRAGRPVDEEQ